VTTLALLALLAQQDNISIREAIVVGGIARGGRLPVPVDAVLDNLANGEYHPTEGMTLRTPSGQVVQWKKLSAHSEGWFEDPALGGGYLCAKIDWPKSEVAILDKAGDSLVYVNGIPRVGDPYGYGMRIPVELKKGANILLFSVGRGRLRASLQSSESYRIEESDTTLPDIVSGQDEQLLGSAVFLNCTSETVRGSRIVAWIEDGPKTTVNMPAMPEAGILKAPFRFRSGKQSGDKANLNVQWLIKGAVKAERQFKLRVRRPSELHRRTFLSSIDGSVQYFAVNPAQKPSKENGIALTLHGASVEGQRQAEVYKPKDWISVVAATNRRPYGFDWEDWGRMDALEVLAQAKRYLPHDPRKIYLTGHSMGGHGTWHVGLTHPDQFAAIAPSAGWVSFFSYGGSPRFQGSSRTDAMLTRAMSPSDTSSLIGNALSQHVYVLHGDADDNVPVREARTMKQLLENVQHPAMQYHEQPGAGHWWGDECVDWPPIFEMFAGCRLPSRAEMTQIDFRSANPAVSSRFGWAEILQQEVPMAVSRIQLSRTGMLIQGSTTNVMRLRLDLTGFGTIETVHIDDTTLSVKGSKMVSLLRTSQGWILDSGGPGEGKSPTRSGPFKMAFNARPLLVYGTHGTTEENAWTRNKARYDAETFYYRGNGMLEVVSDEDLKRMDSKGRNLILYGNAACNGAWDQIRSDCPLKIERGLVWRGGELIYSDDLVTLMVYPREGTTDRLVGVVGISGKRAMALATRMPYFVSGIAYPDWTIVRAGKSLEGAGAIAGLGFFNNEWHLSDR
jgi:dienelactone hydrolase